MAEQLAGLRQGDSRATKGWKQPDRITEPLYVITPATCRVKYCRRPPRDGCKTCEYHLLQGRRLQRARRLEKPNENRAMLRRKYHNRVKLGVCATCARAVVPGRRQCARHLAMNALRSTCWRYGLSKRDLSELLARSGNECESCGEPFDGDGRSSWAMVIDHDHSTGQVRGVIHKACNSAIGVVHERAEVLRCAADYLDRHSGRARVA